MNTKKLIILDYSNGSIHVYSVLNATTIDDTYIENLGYSLFNCEWMSGEDINVIFHKEFLS